MTGPQFGSRLAPHPCDPDCAFDANGNAVQRSEIVVLCDCGFGPASGRKGATAVDLNVGIDFGIKFLDSI
jgi:hypothetical protein